LILVLLGPTAAGKSDLAEALAQSQDGEVVGIDSMQVYRGLEAGTYKPSLAARRRVPHHLVDIADPRHDFNLGDFVRAAEAAIADILARGRLPILAGGTGMYLRGLLKGIDPAPRRDPALRRALEALADRRGTAHLHRILAANDPEAAVRLAPADRMRLVRALERTLASGRPAAGASWARPDRIPALKVGLLPEPEVLRARIDARVEAMFAAGIVAETEALLAAGVPAEGSALKALGYREAVAHLRGELDLPGAIAAAKRHTRQFARRQMTWFRREPDVRWFAVGGDDPARLRSEVENYVRLGRNR
jgi:tRNA dimethylallyltransferase